MRNNNSQIKYNSTYLLQHKYYKNIKLKPIKMVKSNLQIDYGENQKNNGQDGLKDLTPQIKRYMSYNKIWINTKQCLNFIIKLKKILI